MLPDFPVSSMAFRATTLFKMQRWLLLMCFALAVQRCRCDLAPFPNLIHAFSIETQQNLTDLSLPGLTERWGVRSNLISRQLQCLDPGYGNALGHLYAL